MFRVVLALVFGTLVVTAVCVLWTVPGYATSLSNAPAQDNQAQPSMQRLEEVAFDEPSNTCDESADTCEKTLEGDSDGMEHGDNNETVTFVST